VLGKATVFFMVSYLFALTTALYGCLAGFLTKGHSLMESAGSGIGFTICAFTLYRACVRAHEVTHTVRYNNLLLHFIVHEYIMCMTVLRQWKDVLWDAWG
jgi:hypothetical protein